MRNKPARKENNSQEILKSLCHEATWNWTWMIHNWNIWLTSLSSLSVDDASNNIGVFPLVVNFWSPNYYGSHSQDHHIMFTVIHYRSACSVNNVDCSTAMKDISTPALMSHFKRLAYTLMVVDIADLSFEEAVLHSEATEKILGVRIYCRVRLNHPREMSGVTWSALNGLLHRGPDYVPQCDHGFEKLLHPPNRQNGSLTAHASLCQQRPSRSVLEGCAVTSDGRRSTERIFSLGS
ncbi:unnamed protein product [Musa acuminata subsp. malaccensis]|uniref:(wild Malaysian banana) hypothetical protein n=1 Tax=Musa acuminata subsp. malaccensis TaxID=214687 RepID=A0A804JE54_MUSAM|nr:unnamed protein product [Musa acuminata subsp. malaccensis]